MSCPFLRGNQLRFEWFLPVLQSSPPLARFSPQERSEASPCTSNIHRRCTPRQLQAPHRLWALLTPFLYLPHKAEGSPLRRNEESKASALYQTRYFQGRQSDWDVSAYAVSRLGRDGRQIATCFFIFSFYIAESLIRRRRFDCDGYFVFWNWDLFLKKGSASLITFASSPSRSLIFPAGRWTWSLIRFLPGRRLILFLNKICYDLSFHHVLS